VPAGSEQISIFGFFGSGAQLPFLYKFFIIIKSIDNKFPHTHTYRSTFSIESTISPQFFCGLTNRTCVCIGIAEEEVWGTTVVFDHVRDVGSFAIAVRVAHVQIANVGRVFDDAGLVEGCVGISVFFFFLERNTFIKGFG
jgi:hypothetical protein